MLVWASSSPDSPNRLKQMREPVLVSLVLGQCHRTRTVVNRGLGAFRFLDGMSLSWDDLRKRLEALDAYPKTLKDFRVQTSTGAVGEALVWRDPAQ